MAHFAKVVNGKVTNVIVAEPDFFETFVDTTPGEWIQTSYNTKGGIHYNPETGEPSADQSKALRKNFASVGYWYDKDLDAFFPEKTFPSWVLNPQTCLWKAPIPYPGGELGDGQPYRWIEAEGIWKTLAELNIPPPSPKAWE